MLSFDLFAISTVKCNDSVSFLLLFPCFLFSFLRTKSLLFNWRKLLCFWTKRSVGVFISLHDNFVSCSISCRHFQTIFLGLPLENLVLLFAWIKGKEWWRHWTALTAGRFRCYWGSNNNSKLSDEIQTMTLGDVWKFRLGNILSEVAFLVILACENCECN